MMSYRRRRGTDSSMAASLSKMRLEVPAAGAPKRAWNFSHSSMSSLLQGGCAALMRLPAKTMTVSRMPFPSHQPHSALMSMHVKPSMFPKQQ